MKTIIELAKEAAHPFHLESELSIPWWRDNFLPKFAALVRAEYEAPLKLAEEALDSLMIERGSIYQKALAAIREVLAEPVKQEPVAWYIFDKDLATTDSAWAAENEDMCDPLYRAPVDAKAIRAKALEEVEEIAKTIGGSFAEEFLAAIRGLK